MVVYIFTLDDIRTATKRKWLVWKGHAFKRMWERKIRHAEVIKVLQKGEIIQRDQEDVPYPTCKISLELEVGKTLNVVVAYDSSFQEAHIITLYWKI
jgi:hypothetical protein